MLMSQMERILYIDKSIHKFGQFITVKEVANHFEISERQVKRDIEYMRNRLNAPIIWDRVHRAYRYEEEFNDLSFARQNFIISYLALQSIMKNNQYLPVYENSLMSQIEFQIPSDYKILSDKITYNLPQSELIKVSYFEDICTSMRDKKCLDIVYKNTKGELSSRKVEVHHLLNYSGGWFIVTYDYKRESMLTFNISRIAEISLTNQDFIKHDKAFFQDLENALHNNYGIFFGKEKKTVRIKLLDEAQNIISTQVWEKNQKFETFDNYSILEVSVSNYTEVLAKVLSFGHRAIPLEPKDFVDKWKEEIKKLNSLI